MWSYWSDNLLDEVIFLLSDVFYSLLRLCCRTVNNSGVSRFTGCSAAPVRQSCVLLANFLRAVYWLNVTIAQFTKSCIILKCIRGGPYVKRHPTPVYEHLPFGLSEEDIQGEEGNIC